MGDFGSTVTSSATWFRGGNGPRSTVDGVPFEPSRTSDRSGSSLIRRIRALIPGSLKYTALVRARLRPSTFISTVAPRATPSGETELIVGGVVRLPVGQSSADCANAVAARAAASKMFFIHTTSLRQVSRLANGRAQHLSDIVELNGSIEPAGGGSFAIGRKTERQ